MGLTTSVLVLVLLPLLPSPSSSAYRDVRSKFKDGLRYGREASRKPEQGGRAFKYLDYASTAEALAELAKEHPKLVRVWSAQERWGVPSPGECGSKTPCRQWYAQITLDADHAAWENLKAANDPKSPVDLREAARRFGARPEVFFSGSLHGNERVGPTTTVEFARLLVENYVAGHNTWLRRLVETRSIWVMPNANALGYYENVREERTPHSGLIDPNRDFPYGVKAGSCMRTTAGRALNHLFREHLFQMAITFHGGMRAISYEWGSPNHKKYSPDDGALLPLGQRMQQYASGDYYPSGNVGPMNSAVYPVTGGMEDWAYAASWDKTGYVHACSPSTESYPDYPKELTSYSGDMLRIFNFLVETADRKAPLESTLGAVHQVLRPVGAPTDGHVARNLRLALLLTDLVRPYVAWSDVGAHCTQEAVQAWWSGVLWPAALKMAKDNNIGGAPTLPSYTMSWDVGGALHVDDTSLFVWFERVDVAANQDTDGGCGGRLTGGAKPMNPETVPGDVDKVLKLTSHSKSVGASVPSGRRVSTDKKLTKGGSIWNTGKKSGPAETQGNTFAESALFLDGTKDTDFGYNGRYTAKLSMDSELIQFIADEIVSERKSPGSSIRLVVAAGAKVDSGWAKTTRPGVTPESEPPISHVVKARTIPDYRASNNGHTISGQSWWFSERRCMRLLIPDEEASKGDGSESEAQSSKATGPEGKDRGEDGSIEDDPSSASTTPKSKEDDSRSPSSAVLPHATSSASKLGSQSAGANDSSSSSSGPWVVLLLVAGSASCAAICAVTVMHTRGVLQEESRGIVTKDSVSLRKRRTRRRSSQVNELTRLREQDGMASDNDADFETV